MKRCIFILIILFLPVLAFSQEKAVEYDGLIKRKPITFDNLKKDISKYIQEYTFWNITSDNIQDLKYFFNQNQITTSNNTLDQISCFIKTSNQGEIELLFCKLYFEGIMNESNCIIILEDRGPITYMEMHLDNNAILKAIIEAKELEKSK